VLSFICLFLNECIIQQVLRLSHVLYTELGARDMDVNKPDKVLAFLIFFFFLVLEVLSVERRILCLLGRSSTT
jgi:hypothetical protein